MKSGSFSNALAQLLDIEEAEAERWLLVCILVWREKCLVPSVINHLLGHVKESPAI